VPPDLARSGEVRDAQRQQRTGGVAARRQRRRCSQGASWVADSSRRRSGRVEGNPWAGSGCEGVAQKAAFSSAGYGRRDGQADSTAKAQGARGPAQRPPSGRAGAVRHCRPPPSISGRPRPRVRPSSTTVSEERQRGGGGELRLGGLTGPAPDLGGHRVEAAGPARRPGAPNNVMAGGGDSALPQPARGEREMDGHPPRRKPRRSAQPPTRSSSSPGCDRARFGTRTTNVGKEFC